MPTSSEGTTATIPQARRGCLFVFKRVLLGVFSVVVILLILGFAYQTLATEQDKGTFAPRGQLYAVNGHQMHLVCMGEGSPTVILEAGGAAESLWWYRVQRQLAEHTQVCAYDRAGHGWSEAVSTTRDAHTIVEELHTLLEKAGVSSPYLIAGHSFGAVWARIFAAQYPEEVVGIVLVDSTFLSPDNFSSQSEFNQWKLSNDALKVLEWVVYRTGLLRLSAEPDFQRAGYPAEIVPELAALRSPNTVFDADYAEQVAAGWALREASLAAKNLGSLPMIVLWGSQSPTAQNFFAAFRDETSAYSSVSETRFIEGADHGSILGNEAYAQQVSEAILGLVAEGS